MRVLRCTTVWEWLMLFAGIIAGVSALQCDRWLGAQVICAEIALYCLGALNGGRLAEAESSLGNDQVSGD